MALAVGLTVGPEDVTDREARPSRPGDAGSGRGRASHVLPARADPTDAELVEWALDGSDVARAHLRVPRGGADRAVAEQHLDDPDVRARLQQVRGEAVAKLVRGDLLAQLGLGRRRVDGLRHRVARDRVP